MITYKYFNYVVFFINIFKKRFTTMINHKIYQILTCFISGLVSLTIGCLMASIVIVTCKLTNQYGILSSIVLGLFSLLLIFIGFFCFVMGVKIFVSDSKIEIDSIKTIDNSIPTITNNNLIAPVHYVARMTV